MLETVYKQLTDFFIEYNRDIFDEPLRGDILMVYHAFVQWIQQNQNRKKLKEDVIDAQEFKHRVVELGKLCDNGLMFDPAVQHEKYGCEKMLMRLIKITWINMTKLQLLSDRIESKKKKEIKFGKAKCLGSEKLIGVAAGVAAGVPIGAQERLFLLLNQPFYTTIKADISYAPTVIAEHNIDLSTMSELLIKTSATSQLTKKKVSLKTPVKPYYEVCDDSSHCQTLSLICLSKKETGKLGIPDLVQVHRVLQQTRGSMANEVFRCSQSKIHFLPIITPQTDMSLGDCSYLDTCHKMKGCRYLHYFTLQPLANKSSANEQLKETNKEASTHEYTEGECYTEYQRKVLPAQWINCDVRYLPFLILGKFAAIVSDPAWDIHMSLPYGTCKDFELLSLPMNELQDEGIIMLWVTGRSIEVGRQALRKWGYNLTDEVIWIKLNQLKRTIVTGRTGHWLNHSKEHLLVGIKGNPPWIKRLVDTDVIVSGTRETLRKPDEIYDIVERIVGSHSRKLEIFGRDHNIRPGWLSKF